MSFPAALERVTEVLKAHGFGVLTTVDVAATLKTKLGVEMGAYLILGACNPKMAHQALSIDPTVGVFLPCNVVLREVDGGVELRAVDPMQTLGSRESVRGVALQVRTMLEEAVAQS
jgi:uncharacterized protein (DUF302 family)